MVLVKEVSTCHPYEMEEELNDVLKELQRDGKKIINIRYVSQYQDYCGIMSALIIYEE